MSDLFDEVESSQDLFDEIELPTEEKVIYSEEMKKLVKEEVRKEISNLPIGPIVTKIVEKKSSQQSEKTKELKKDLEKEIEESEEEIDKVKKEVKDLKDKFDDKYKELKTNIINSSGTFYQGGPSTIRVQEEDGSDVGFPLSLKFPTGSITVNSDGSYSIAGGGGGSGIGGTIAGGTAGSVLFINPDGILAQDNANLFWDYNNNRLGIGTNTPGSAFEVKDLIKFDNAQLNITIGYQAYSNNVSGFLNTAIGYHALFSCTSGVQNYALGPNALYSLLDGDYNTAIGYDSAYYLTSGSSNISMGIFSLYRNTTGDFNIAIGADSLENNITGDNNIGIGEHALWNNTGSNSIGIGFFAGAYDTASNSFYLDNFDRTNLAGGKAKSLMYGTFNTTALNQTLRFNASLSIYGKSNLITLTGTKIVGGAVSSGPVYIENENYDFMLGNSISSGSYFRLLPYLGDIYFENYNPASATIVGNIIFRHDWNAGAGIQEDMRIDVNGNLGVGVSTVSARVHIIKTTEQLRVGYDASNYYSTTVGSTGIATFNAVGASSAFVFSDSVGIGATPAAVLHLAAGTATASTAPLKFTSGTLLTTAEAGAVEFLTDKFYATITTGAARKELALNDTALTSTRIPFSTTNGRLTDSSNLTFVTDTLTCPKLIGSTYVQTPTIKPGADSTSAIQITQADGVTVVANFDTSNKRFGIGTIPTAFLHLKAGTGSASGAPLKFNTGSLMGTAEAGAVEFNSDSYYVTTTTGAVRRMVVAGNTGRSTGQTAAVASVATYTLGAADASFQVSANVLVTASTTHTVAVQVDYTDEGNTARTLTLNFSQLSGTIINSITNVTGVGPYEGFPAHIRCKASTAITVKTTGVFTSITYSVEAVISQIA